ncbi:hypothetical protein Tco_1378721 [Tanacetum coccineum]
MVDSFRRPPRGGAEEEQLSFLLSRMNGLILTNIPDRWVWSLESTCEFSVIFVRQLIDDSIIPNEEVATRNQLLFGAKNLHRELFFDDLVQISFNWCSNLPNKADHEAAQEAKTTRCSEMLNQPVLSNQWGSTWEKQRDVKSTGVVESKIKNQRIWRRLVFKVSATMIGHSLDGYLDGLQFGVGVSGGGETILHAVNRLVEDRGDDVGLLMLLVDFQNAFNLVDRTVMLEEVRLRCPAISRYFAFGWHLDDLHVTWAHLEKKRTRLLANTKTLEDLCLQSGVRIIQDDIAAHQATASHDFTTASARADSKADLEDSFHDGVTPIKRRSRCDFPIYTNRI